MTNSYPERVNAALAEHYGWESPEYSSWASMKQRCLNPNQRGYKDYGGRGISICDRWMHSFQNFVADMGPRPDGFQLDRIDTDGNYEPGNCQWSDRKTQMNNTRRNRWITINNETRTMTQWCEFFGVVPIETFRHRRTRGWPTLTALITPPMQR